MFLSCPFVIVGHCGCLMIMILRRVKLSHTHLYCTIIQLLPIIYLFCLFQKVECIIHWGFCNVLHCIKHSIVLLFRLWLNDVCCTCIWAVLVYDCWLGFSKFLHLFSYPKPVCQAIIRVIFAISDCLFVSSGGIDCMECLMMWQHCPQWLLCWMAVTAFWGSENLYQFCYAVKNCLDGLLMSSNRITEKNGNCIYVILFLYLTLN